MSVGGIDLFGEASPASLRPTSRSAKRSERAAATGAQSYRTKTMLRTREKLLGISAKSLAARTTRTLKSLRGQVAGIGAAFEDIDMGVVGAAEQLMADFDEFEQAVKDSVNWLKEEPEGY